MAGGEDEGVCAEEGEVVCAIEEEEVAEEEEEEVVCPGFAMTLACRHLLSGRVIAVPTDTVYGLAALVQNSPSIRSIYQFKDHDPKKPIAICLSKVEDIGKWGIVTGLPTDLLDALLPGKVTVVLERKSRLNPAFNPTSSKVGIRVPDCDFLHSVIDQVNQPLALMSAPTLHGTFALHSDEILHFWPNLGSMFCDDQVVKPEEMRAGSTVIDLSKQGKYSVIRNGVCLEDVKEILKTFKLEECYEN